MDDPIRKIFSGAVLKDGSLNDREIRVVASDATVDRAGDVVVPSGCRLEAFTKNPIVLANHNPEHPIGTARATIQNNRVEALITFAPPGLSKLADEWCGLAKAKILNAISIGFTPIEHEPIKGGGTRFTEWELLELSFVSVPANPNAVVIGRSAREAGRPSPGDSCSRLSKRLADFDLRALDEIAAEVRKTRYDVAQSAAKNREALRVWNAERPKGPLKQTDGRFHWDPYKDAATNTFNLRCWEMRGGRVM